MDSLAGATACEVLPMRPSHLTFLRNSVTEERVATGDLPPTAQHHDGVEERDLEEEHEENRHRAVRAEYT